MIDEFSLALIKENPELKKAYEAYLLQEFKNKELNAKTNYNALKAKINQNKEKPKGVRQLGKETF